MKFHRDLIAVVLPLVLLLPSFGPLLGAPGAGSSCLCQGDSCCLRHGRPAPVSSEAAHDDHHGGHGSHGQSSEAPGSEEPASEGAACHLPGPSPSEPQPAGLKLSATCGAGSPVPAPPSVRRDAISGLEDGGHAALVVSYGDALARQRTLPVSYFAEPPSPPPRSA